MKRTKKKEHMMNVTNTIGQLYIEGEIEGEEIISIIMTEEKRGELTEKQIIAIAASIIATKPILDMFREMNKIGQLVTGEAK